VDFDYYYGKEAEQFSFYRIPRLLIKDERFKRLSSDAKLLYGLMLDRMSLSMANGWFDAENRAYIIYTVDAIMEDLGCARATCVKTMKELDADHGIGLIEKKRRGLGKPDIIYVKNFSMVDSMHEKYTEHMEADRAEQEGHTSRSSEIELSEVQNLDFRKFKNNTSASSDTEPAEVQNSDSNYTDFNQTDKSNINPINPSSDMNFQKDGIDVIQDTGQYITQIKENIEYDHHMKYDNASDRKLYQELFEVICEIVCIKRTTVRIAGENYPYELVRSRFLLLNSWHLDYVMNCMQKNTNGKIANIKNYMVTALYNAPVTMNHYYQQEVQHDMYKT
jgi:hypothetical protein